MKELPNPTFPLSPIALPRIWFPKPGRKPEAPVAAQAVRTELQVSWAKHQDEVRRAAHPCNVSRLCWP